MPLNNLSRQRHLKYIQLFLVVIGILVLWRYTRPASTNVKSPHTTHKKESIILEDDEDGNSPIHHKYAGTDHWDDDISEQFLMNMDRKTPKCINYVDYSQVPHAPFSRGRLRFPYMRPPPKCRTFYSRAVEKLIDDLKSKIKDPDLARLVENCLPNTLDTTILWHRPVDSKSNSNGRLSQYPETFVVTGDIHAEWLRDSARQLSVYQPLIRYDNDLKIMIQGAIRTQEEYIINSPYCNAFHPPPGSGVKRGNTAKDNVYPRPDWSQVFECKYEIDSLASFLTLTTEYLENTDGDLSIFTTNWMKAYEKILVVLKRESQPSFDSKTGQALPFYYSFQRDTNIGSETLPLAGVGNPVNFDTGLIRSAFRPSDDSTILQFFVPGNAHLLTELKRIRKYLFDTKLDSRFDIKVHRDFTDQFIKNIEDGLKKHAVVEHPKWGRVFAFEVDGYGSSVFMDDANLPSLLSLPDIGYVDKNDEVYQNTRKMVLSKSGNPYYLKGLFFEGIGGPHIGIENAWPMSLLVAIRTSDDDNEIATNLKTILETTAGLGLMHESVRVNSRSGFSFTRSWFAWCNSELGKTILYLAKNKPHLIFKEEYSSKPYDLEALFA